MLQGAVMIIKDASPIPINGIEATKPKPHIKATHFISVFLMFTFTLK